jgi:diguanylate cyclase (GGDEF)-like protein
LRTDGRFALAPIIVVSADAARDVRAAAFVAGVTDFIDQSVDPQELIARLGGLLALQDARAQEAARVQLLESWLRQDQQRLRRQADRFASLWRIANNADLSENELMQEILDQSTAAMRSGQFFISSLSRFEGDAIVVEAKTYDPDIFHTHQVAQVGTRIPLDDAVEKLPLESGITHSWDDVSLDPVASHIARVRSAGCRALICTPFKVDRSTFFLTYWSRDPVSDPFGSDDDTYVELVAMFFAVRLREWWQSNRLNYHLTRDPLTGIRNRTHFLLDARAGYAVERSGAVAIIDIVGFRNVNESYGHIIGDALLVEVGTALELRAIEAARSGTITARLAGATFGIFMPGVTSHQAALAAVEPFTDALAIPFAGGEGNGRATVPLAARVGVAWSADPHAVVDELIAHADTALYAAKRHGPGHVEVYDPESDAGAMT